MKKNLRLIILVGAILVVSLTTNAAAKADKIALEKDSQINIGYSGSENFSTINTNNSSPEMSSEENDETSKETLVPSQNGETKDNNDVKTETNQTSEESDQDVINKIGSGENFNSKLYLNYFGNQVEKILKTYPQDKIPEQIGLLIFIECSMSPGKFDVNLPTIQHLISTYILYDIAFAKESYFMSFLGANNDGTSPDENTGYYPHTQQLEGVSLNYQNGQSMDLKSLYVDQKSDKTVIIHGGFRGNWNNGIITPEYDQFYQSGYNILFVESRATGGSGGDYVTYGQYESDDVLYWIDQEVKNRPNQKIILYGGSMGASTMMSVLSKNIPNNVKGIIENCGFSSIDEQLRFTYSNIVAPAMPEEIAPSLDIIGDKSHENMYLDLLKVNYFDQELHLNTTQNLPEKGMANTLIPKLIIHGSLDNVVPVSNAQKLYDLSKGYKDLLIVDGAGHGESQKVDPTAYKQHLTDFLRVIFNDKVKVKYVDEEDKSLIDTNELVISGSYGEAYKTEEKEFKNYQLITVDGKTEGYFNETIPTVVYTYKKVQNSTEIGSSTSSSAQPNSPSLSDNKNLHHNQEEVKTLDDIPEVSGGEATKKVLPTTGDNSAISYVIVGILIICSGLWILVFKLKGGSQKDENI